MSRFACIYQATGQLYGSGGWDWAGLPCGVVRVSYGFFGGVLLARLRVDRVRLPPIASPLIVAMFPLALFVAGDRTLICFILIGIPGLVALAAMAEPPPAFISLFGSLGALSYPLYAIHKPAHALTTALLARTGWTVSAFTSEEALAVALVLGAYGLDRTYDRPLRQLLSRRPPLVVAEPAIT